MSEETKEELIESEELAGSSSLAVVEPVPEEKLERVKVDHSKLYVWIADAGNDRIQKFDGNGKFLFQFGKPGGTRPPYNPGEFKTPGGVAVDMEGNIVWQYQHESEISTSWI